VNNPLHGREAWSRPCQRDRGCRHRQGMINAISMLAPLIGAIWFGINPSGLVRRI
jgi:hypothetical protein